MGGVEGTCDMYGIEEMGSYKIATIIEELLGGVRSSRAKRYDKSKG